MGLKKIKKEGSKIKTRYHGTANHLPSNAMGNGKFYAALWILLSHEKMFHGIKAENSLVLPAEKGSKKFFKICVDRAILLYMVQFS
ncbi:MAG: hypothetical protein LBJ94_01390 [Puniceicoccales bacterium]|jgi:hypothetical protein|nr:hypothetical protein [Puniceicoccales bacterium]